ATPGANYWATLAEGTPLVTATHRDKGRLVPFLVTGDTRWPALPLSGAFVDMLKRIVALSGTTIATEGSATSTKNARAVAAPSHILDGFGSFVAPPPTARPVPEDFLGIATRDHPPGFYGPPESLLAVNTLAGTDRLAALDFPPLVNASREVYRTSEPQDLRGPILLAAVALLLLDSIIVLFLGGGIQRLIPRHLPAAAASILVLA